MAETVMQYELAASKRELAIAFAGNPPAYIRIVDEPIPGSRRRRLTATWDKWKGIGQPERTIPHNFERTRPDKRWRVLGITLAPGPTSVEASKLNLTIA